MILGINGIIAGKGSIPLDVDAQAFITAASITDSTQKSAINQLVLDLKSANIWTKMKAIYPFVGGTASQHRFNLKIPTTNASDFYLTFYGGGTHSNNGYKPNGVDAYANTFFTPSLSLSANSAHLSYYSRDSATSSANNYVIGADNASAFSAIVLRDNSKYFGFSNVSTAFEGANYNASLSTNGFFIGTQDVNNIKLLRNNVNIAQNTNTDTRGLQIAQIYIGCSNSYSSPQAHTTAECAFASIGDYLTDSDATAFYNAVQTFNTTLSRQV